jgi:ferredoxin-nitrite reductase
MNDQPFTPEQQQYLKGFIAGVEARRAAAGAPPGPGGGTPPADPDDPQRAAQDRLLASAGRLSALETAKRARHPLDRMDEIEARAATGRFPSGHDNFLDRWHGLFYVSPAEDAFMCRLRIPGGIVTAYQFRGIAQIAQDLAGGFADCTTRANMQLRGITAANAPEVLRRLSEIGLTSRGSGADNVRNITGSPTAGIDRQELLDTRPHTRAMHFHILNTRALYGLPRKFNIAFDGGGTVPVLEDTNDIGFAAARLSRAEAMPPGVYYRLALGGITGHGAFAGDTGVAVSPDQAVRVADAILRVFIGAGNRTDRAKARLKYLLDDWGLPRFLAAVEAQLGQALPRVPPGAFEPPPPADRQAHLGVHAQKQPGLCYIGVAGHVGRLTTAQMNGLAAVADRLGSGIIRLTVWQNLIISDIAQSRVGQAVAELGELGLRSSASALRAGLVACTGNAGCKFAASDTKRHASALVDWLESRVAVSAPLNIHLTGCPHSCAQHLIGDIGLIGARVRQGEASVEGYDLHVGGGAGPAQAIGRKLREKIPADEVPPVVLALLRAWQAEAPQASFQLWATRHDDAALARICDQAVPPADGACP